MAIQRFFPSTPAAVPWQTHRQYQAVYSKNPFTPFDPFRPYLTICRFIYLIVYLIMFKKRSAAAHKQSKTSLRKRDNGNDNNSDNDKERNDNDNDNDDDNSNNNNNSLQPQIQLAKKRRKLLTALQYKRGLDTQQLLLPHQQQHQRQQQQQDRVDPVEDTVATLANDRSASAGIMSAATTTSSQEGILELKHQQAMERYIQQQIAGSSSNTGDSAVGEAVDTAQLGLAAAAAGQDWTKEQLYRALAHQSAALAGKSVTKEAVVDGDKGAGGAMLVAGTGIAEVVLPVQSRLEMAQETSAAVRTRTSTATTTTTIRSNSAGGSSGRTAPPASAVPNRFSVPTMQFFPGTRPTNSAAAVATAAAEAAAVAAANDTVDSNRVGFAAARQQHGGQAAGTTGATGTASQSQAQTRNPKVLRASDDRVYKKFMTRQRDQQMRDKK